MGDDVKKNPSTTRYHRRHHSFWCRKLFLKLGRHFPFYFFSSTIPTWENKNQILFKKEEKKRNFYFIFIFLYLPGGSSGAASYRLNLAPSLSHSLTPLVSYAAVVCRVGGAHNGGKVQAVCVCAWRARVASHRRTVCVCASSHVSGAPCVSLSLHHLYENRPTFPRSDIDITHWPGSYTRTNPNSCCPWIRRNWDHLSLGRNE